MSLRKSTLRLVAALMEADNDGKLIPVIARARTDYYHDYFGVPELPEHQLVHDLRAVDHDDLAQRVIAGEFDATKEESDEWAASPDGQAAMAELPPALRKAMFGK